MHFGAEFLWEVEASPTSLLLPMISYGKDGQFGFTSYIVELFLIEIEDDRSHFPLSTALYDGDMVNIRPTWSEHHS